MGIPLPLAERLPCSPRKAWVATRRAPGRTDPELLSTSKPRVVEMVLADVRHHAETQMVAGMIEDEKIGLPRRGAKSAADRLDEEHAALVGLASMMQRTSRSTPVVSTPTLQMIRVSPDRKRAKVSSRTSRGVSPSIYSARDARLEESLSYVLRVTAIDAEAERRPPLAALEPGLDNVAGDDWPIHRLSKLALMKIARHGADVR